MAKPAVHPIAKTDHRTRVRGSSAGRIQPGTGGTPEAARPVTGDAFRPAPAGVAAPRPPNQTGTGAPLTLFGASATPPTGGWTVDQMVAYFMEGLSDGRESPSGHLSQEKKPLFEKIHTALLGVIAKKLDSRLWDEVVAKCARKWITVYNVKDRELDSLAEGGMTQLRAALLRKFTDVQSLSLARQDTLTGIHRHSFDVIKTLRSEYGQVIAYLAMLSDSPLRKAKGLQEASDSALATAKAHPSGAVRGIAASIAYATVHRAIEGEAAGKKFAGEVINGYLAALEWAGTYTGAAIRKNAATIAHAATEHGVLGKDAGRIFAREAIEGYQAVLERVRTHSNKRVKKIAPTVATSAARGGIQGTEAGTKFANAVIEGYLAALGTARANPDKAVRKIALTIASAAAGHGIQGREAGKNFAGRVIEGRLAALKIAQKHSLMVVKRNAVTIASAAAHCGIRGKKAGESFAREVIEGYLAALDTAQNHSETKVRNNASRIASAAANQGTRGKKAGSRFVETYATRRFVPRGFATVDVMALPVTLLAGGLNYLMGELGSEALMGNWKYFRELSLRKVVKTYSLLTIGSKAGDVLAKGALALPLFREASAGVRAFIGRAVPLFGAFMAMDLGETGRINFQRMPGSAVNVMLAGGLVQVGAATLSAGHKIKILGSALKFLSATPLSAVASVTVQFLAVKVLGKIESEVAESAQITVTVEEIGELLREDQRLISGLVGGAPDSMGNLSEIDNQLAAYEDALRHQKNLGEREVLAEFEEAKAALAAWRSARMARPLDGSYSYNDIEGRYNHRMQQVYGEYKRNLARVETPGHITFARLPVDPKGEEGMWTNFIDAVDQRDVAADTDMDGNPRRNMDAARYSALFSRDRHVMADQIADYRARRASVIRRHQSAPTTPAPVEGMRITQNLR